MGLLSRGQAMLDRTLGASEGVAVTYTRKVFAGTKSVALTARGGGARSGGLEQDALLIKESQRDWLIAVADLAFAGVPTTPRRGDRITDPGGLVWELADTDTGEDAWRYSDNTRTLYRVHTRRVAT